MKAIADTGLIVGFINRTDQYHDWAVRLARDITEPLLTCEAVLAEAAFHLQSSAIVLKLVRDGMVTPALDVTDHVARLTELAERYQDRKPDLADLCLIRLSELYPRLPIITTDVEDFRVYKRFRRDAIPFICPPATSSL